MNLKCFFGHNAEDLRRRFVIDEGFGRSFVRYAARCKNCGKVWLESSHGPEQWSQLDAITEEEALDKIRKFLNP